MSPRRVYTTLLVAVPAALLTSSPASGSSPWLPGPDDFHIRFSAGHFSASSFYDQDGRRVRLGGGTLFQGRAVVSQTELGWLDRLSLAFTIPVVGLTVRSDDLRFTETLSGFGDLNLGIRLKLVDGGSAIALAADWKAPMGYEHDRFISLGAGQQDLTGSLRAGTGVRSLNGFVQASGGFRYRFEDPLNELVYAADLAFWPGPSLLVSGRFRGVRTLGSESGALGSLVPSPNSPSDLKYDFQSLGPELVYRIDDRLEVFAGSSYTIAGSNVVKGTEYYAGVAFKQIRLNRLQGFLGSKRQP